MNILKVGNNIYDDSFLLSGSLIQETSLVGDELPYDTSRFNLLVKRPSAYLLDSNLNQLVTIRGELLLESGSVVGAEFNIGDPVTWEYDDELLMRHYITDVTRVGQYQYQIDCASGVGKLAEQTHFGGLYFGSNYSDIVAEIIGDTIPYSISSELSAIKVYGWLPVATKRDNLMQLLFATNTRIKQTGDGNIELTYYNVASPLNIPENKIAQGARLTFPAAVSSVAITEHQYAQTSNDLEVTLYDGEVPSQTITTPKGNVVQGACVTFNEPCYNLAIVGGSIIESGVNYAVLSPSANATLTGYPYSHITATIVRPQGAARDSSTIEVPSATLVNSLNSEGIASKVLSYYQSSESAEMDVWDSAGNTGSLVQFKDAYGNTVQGRVESKQSTMSANLRSSVKVVSDYVPSMPGNVYHGSIMVDGNKTIQIASKQIKVNGQTVATGVGDTIRLILVGGGDGGNGGDGGYNGGIPINTGTQWQYSDHGYGGGGGTGGKGGKILIQKITLADYASSGVVNFSVNCGSGGIRGTAGLGHSDVYEGEGGVGASGTATTAVFSSATFSSNSGENSVNGYRDMFLGVTVGVPGTNGIKGGNGGMYSNTPSLTPLFVASSEDVNGFRGGADGGSFNASGTYDDHWLSSQGFGGLGGGASNIGGGKDGSNGDAWATRDGSSYNSSGGAGGDGADAGSGSSATYYGCGGNGGHGGGGGGDAGTCWVDNTGLSKLPKNEGAAGDGGNGGAGGSGYAGCVFIIY